MVFQVQDGVLLVRTVMEVIKDGLAKVLQVTVPIMRLVSKIRMLACILVVGGVANQRTVIMEVNNGSQQVAIVVGVMHKENMSWVVVGLDVLRVPKIIQIVQYLCVVLAVDRMRPQRVMMFQVQDGVLLVRTVMHVFANGSLRTPRVEMPLANKRSITSVCLTK